MTKRALIYTRVSRDESGERQSVERQLAADRALCAARGWEIVGELSDNSISAFSGKDRPAWNEVLGKVGRGECDVVVAWHVDRMTRSVLELEHLILLAEEHGVGIATATGDIDLTTDAGRMVARILAAVARAEVERKAARQVLANQQRAERGEVHRGGPRPFGFEPDKVTLKDDEVAEIRRSVDELLAGGTLAAVAKRWGRTPRTVKRALLSPRYAGKREHNGEIYPATWPAIIDEDTQVALMLRLAREGNGGSGKVQNLLTGIATCEVCGETVRAHKSNGKHDAYSCPSGHSYARREESDEYVGAWVVGVLSQPEVLAELTPTEDASLDKARSERDEAKTRLDDLAEAFAAGEITRSQLTAGSTRLRRMLDEAERTLAEAMAGSALEGIAVGTPQVEAQWLDLELHRQRELVDLLFDVEIRPAANRRAPFNPVERIAVSRSEA